MEKFKKQIQINVRKVLIEILQSEYQKNGTEKDGKFEHKNGLSFEDWLLQTGYAVEQSKIIQPNKPKIIKS